MEYEKLYQKALVTRAKYNNGIITAKEAKAELAEYEHVFNELAKKLAKKYNKQPQKFNFNSFMR